MLHSEMTSSAQAAYFSGQWGVSEFMHPANLKKMKDEEHRPCLLAITFVSFEIHQKDHRPYPNSSGYAI